jgi:hypothetical protein
MSSVCLRDLLPKGFPNFVLFAKPVFFLKFMYGAGIKTFLVVVCVFGVIGVPHNASNHAKIAVNHSAVNHSNKAIIITFYMDLWGFIICLMDLY